MAKYQTANDALDAMERANKEWITKARKIAMQIASEGNGVVTVDDVRQRIEPPPGADPRIMGAVFNERGLWRPAGWVSSARKMCHHRPIRKWRLNRPGQG